MLSLLLLLSSEHGIIHPQGEHRPLMMVVNSPARELAGVRVSDLIALADEAAAATTDFRIVELEVGPCLDPVRADKLFTCVADAALKGNEDPTYLLMISIRAVSDGSRVLAALFDLQTAVRLMRDHPSDWDEELEARMIDDAVAVHSEPEHVASSEILRTWVRRLFEEGFRATFASSGHWRPYGSIDIRSDLEGAAILLDEREIGKTSRGGTTLDRVLAGRRTIALIHPEFERFEQVVEVRTGANATVEPVMVSLPDPVVGYSRTAVMIIGAASAAAGVGLIAYAVAKPKRYAVCVEFQEGLCEGSAEMARFGASEGLLSSPNGSGPPIAALGYSLIGMGAVWSLGTLIFDSHDRMPWIELAAGVLVFGASLALSYALDGQNAIEAMN